MFAVMWTRNIFLHLFSEPAYNEIIYIIVLQKEKTCDEKKPL